jgi:hypothetical protein
MQGNANATSCLMSFSATGVTAADSNAVILAGSALQRASATSVISGLTPGSNTFTAKYRNQGTGALTCSYQDRLIMVIPLP